jgi:hypothetical protein
VAKLLAEDGWQRGGRRCTDMRFGPRCPEEIGGREGAGADASDGGGRAKRIGLRASERGERRGAGGGGTRSRADRGMVEYGLGLLALMPSCACESVGQGGGKGWQLATGAKARKGEGRRRKEREGEGRRGKGECKHLRELHCGTCGVGRGRRARLERSKGGVGTCGWCWRGGGGGGHDRVSVLVSAMRMGTKNERVEGIITSRLRLHAHGVFIAHHDNQIVQLPPFFRV